MKTKLVITGDPNSQWWLKPSIARVLQTIVERLKIQPKPQDVNRDFVTIFITEEKWQEFDRPAGEADASLSLDHVSVMLLVSPDDNPRASMRISFWKKGAVKATLHKGRNQESRDCEGSEQKAIDWLFDYTFKGL